MVLVVLVLPAEASATAPTGTPPSGIAGALYDTTCGDGCPPSCPPPCTVAQVICAQTQPAIVCPLEKSQAPRPTICLQSGCGIQYPPYEGDGATITVRRAGSETVLRTVTPNQGRFSIPLGAGRYVLRGHVALPCWSDEKVVVTVRPGHWTTGAEVQVRDDCIVHPDAAG